MTREVELLQYLHYHPQASRSEIMGGMTGDMSESSVKRLLSEALNNGLVEVAGKGRGTKYNLTPQAHVTMPLDLDTYFAVEMDERVIQTSFNFDLIRNVLPHVELFTADERKQMEEAHAVFRHHMEDMTPNEYHKEMERLGVDLSWKSSQIEGNTYTLLETERLLKERRTAEGKSREEAIMLLNHKEALDFIISVPDYLKELSVHRIEDIHSLLVKDLNVDRNIRHRRVGIIGTNYMPLDNEFQIREAVEDACELINQKESVFDKALLALVLLSYIHAFNDGNKRTARITSNAILIANGYCPLSFRTVDSIDYKKAMLIFYEQNNISAFKRIFIEQYLFAVKTYF